MEQADFPTLTPGLATIVERAQGSSMAATVISRTVLKASSSEIPEELTVMEKSAHSAHRDHLFRSKPITIPGKPKTWGRVLFPGTWMC
jgi:hypothetical protein